MPTFKHYFNTYETTLSENLLNSMPYGRETSETNLIIYNLNNPISYGFFFIRELKLWQQYNLNYIDTSYINLNSITYGLYSPLLRRSEGRYPGLITLIRSEFKISEYEEAIEGKYNIENLVIDSNDADLPYKRKNTLDRGTKAYIGYNLIDPTNSDYYKTLILCEEGMVYNSLYNYCEKPSYTKCGSGSIPADTKDTCMVCPESEKYLDPVDGLCKSACPTGYYERDDMNQCRPCNATCYKCNWTFGFNCTECTGDRYLVEHEGRCVQKCEEYNLTASNITNNWCTGFDSFAILINRGDYYINDKGIQIYENQVDINIFDNLEGKVINYTSRDYTVEWAFERQKTIEVNEGSLYIGEKENPLIGDIYTEEKVLLNRTFFKNAKKYIFSLTVIAHNILYYDSIVTKTHYFLLTTNSYPVNGTLTVIPTNGLYRSTYFVIKCENWEDDTSPKEKLQYRFYSKEVNTNNLILLRDWSLENEISRNFSVMYYQQEKSDIDITCEIKDELNATTSENARITIAKSLTGNYYSLSDAILAYPEIPEEDKSYEKYDVLLYHRSLFLLSLASDPYKTAYPSFLQTQYEPTLQGDMILMEDPTGVSDYCNGVGDIVLVDEFIICRCKDGWVGKYCQIDANGINDLEQRFNDLYNEIMGALYTSISWYEFMTVYNIFKGAALFIPTASFIEDNIKNFLDQFAMVSFSSSIANNTMEYFDILDFYYSYELMRMEKIKADIQKQNNLGRQVNLTNAQMNQFK